MEGAPAGRRRWLAFALAAGLAALLVWIASGFIAAAYLREGQARAEATLRLTIQALDGHLRRFEALPELLADDPSVRRVVAGPIDPAAILALNRWLAERNHLLDTSQIYVMDRSGVTLAASNSGERDSFVGRDFGFRPYFRDALAGRKGRFFALGTTSGIRGFYFAAPVRDADGSVAGVIAVKVDLDVIEADWRRQEDAIFVTDPEGIVFLSTEAGWLHRALLPLTPERLARAAETLRHSGRDVTALPHEEGLSHGLPFLRLTRGEMGERSYLVASKWMPLAGWTVHVLLDTSGPMAQARLATLALALLAGIGGVAALLIRSRRVRLAERIALQEAAQAELERRVEERTADLARVNARIEAEIAERRLTEQELRRTQADLVQAGKLAALGQMSAALSHEINQPLAAARNYADSALILIARGEERRALENVEQILSLIDRMAAIAKHLRHVARKPDQPLQDLDLAEAVAEALVMARPRLEAAGAEVRVDIPPDLGAARGGPVRLQQVLVNILANAADAVEEGVDRRISIHARREGGRILLDIRDHGPGVAPAIADRIFDPFFTTKRVGSGLGLGLSISYNIMKDFGGDLRVANHPGGGAVFTLDLEAARHRDMAAE